MQLKLDFTKGKTHAACVIHANNTTHAIQASLNLTKHVLMGNHGLARNAGRRRLERQKGVRRSGTGIPYHQSCWAARLAEAHRQMKPRA